MDVFEAIAKEMDEKIAQLKDYLASGRTTNHEECGWNSRQYNPG